MEARNSDELYLFFQQFASQLKLNSSAAIDNIYNKVKGNIDYDDFMVETASDIKDGLKECGIKSGLRVRIVKALNTIKESQIYKDSNPSQSRLNIQKIQL